MTINKLASEIAKREGRKSQARIGDIREILGILSDVCLEAGPVDFVKIGQMFLINGEKRAKKRGKK